MLILSEGGLVTERDDLEATIEAVKEKHPSLAARLSQSDRLVLVLTDEMTDEEKEMRCYAYYLQRGYSPARAEQEAQDLLLMLDSMDKTFH